jgi:hypothetical protein
MRTTAGLATLCLLATMSPAGQQSGGDSPRRRQKMAFPATLTAHFRTTADQLQVEYVVTNAGREPLYVINVSIRVTSQGATVEPATPRAALASTGELVLASAIPPSRPQHQLCSSAPILRLTFGCRGFAQAILRVALAGGAERAAAQTRTARSCCGPGRLRARRHPGVRRAQRAETRDWRRRGLAVAAGSASAPGGVARRGQGR